MFYNLDKDFPKSSIGIDGTPSNVVTIQIPAINAVKLTYSTSLFCLFVLIFFEASEIHCKDVLQALIGRCQGRKVHQKHFTVSAICQRLVGDISRLLYKKKLK